VLVKQAVLNDTVGKLTAADWFARKSQFKRDFPDDIVIVSWELVPGQVMLPTDLKQDPKVWGAYFFARYSGAGDHRASVGTDRSVIVALDDNDFTVAPAK
jgi:type VI secretion system protein